MSNGGTLFNTRPECETSFSVPSSGVSTPVPSSVASSKSDSPTPLSSPFSYEDTTIIFDWDDTLLSSSWLAHNKWGLDEPSVLPPAAVSALSALSESVVALIARAQRLGRVVVITNAETGWVELSCKKFMPKAWAVVSTLRVLSARSTYEHRARDNPSEWKVMAFREELSKQFAGRRSGCTRNVLSLGDSVHERLAILKVTDGLEPACRTKSIKFVERPTVEQLQRQVDLVANSFEEICRHDGRLDLMLTISLLSGKQGSPNLMGGQ